MSEKDIFSEDESELILREEKLKENNTYKIVDKEIC